MNSLSLYDFENDLKALHLDLNVSEFYELTDTTRSRRSRSMP